MLKTDYFDVPAFGGHETLSWRNEECDQIVTRTYGRSMKHIRILNQWTRESFHEFKMFTSTVDQSWM